MVDQEIDLTVSAFIVRDRKIFLVKHKKLGLWLPVGGHIEPNETPDDALRREVREELNGAEIEFLQYPQIGEYNQRKFALPFYVDLHPIKEGHRHFGLCYLCRSKKRDILEFNPQELEGTYWFSSEDLDLKDIPRNVKETSLLALDLANMPF